MARPTTVKARIVPPSIWKFKSLVRLGMQTGMRLHKLHKSNFLPIFLPPIVLSAVFYFPFPHFPF